MIETRTIAVVAYRDPNGQPTCSSNFADGKTCQFLRVRKFGLVEVCAAMGHDLARDVDFRGYLRPDKLCPVWGEA